MTEEIIVKLKKQREQLKKIIGSKALTTEQSKAIKEAKKHLKEVNGVLKTIGE